MTKKTPTPFRYSAPDPSKPTVVYVDKVALYEALCEHKKSVVEAVNQGLEPPRVTEYIGKCIRDICYGLGTRYNFRNYPFNDELISVGILDCLKAVRSFNPDDPKKNPYGYFTYVAFMAMAGYIKKEKNILAGKNKYIRQMDIDLASYQDHDEGGYSNTLVQYLQNEIDTASLQDEHEKKYETVETEIEVSLDDKRSDNIGGLDFL